MKIADGDTLTVLDGARNQHKIRLAGIDAPEKAQAFGTQARNALASAVFRQTVRVDVTDTDRYGREVGRVFCAGHFVNADLVRARVRLRYPQWDKAGEFAPLETAARRHRRGLWADSNPIQPWEFRKAKRGGANVSATLNSSPPSEIFPLAPCGSLSGESRAEGLACDELSRAGVRGPAGRVRCQWLGVNPSGNSDAIEEPSSHASGW